MHIHDYCLGCLSGAWGIHHIDIAQWGNNSDDTGPLEIEGSGFIPSDGLCDTPVTWRVEHTYANGVKMIHMDSRNTEKEFPQFVTPVLETRGCGILFVGSDGWVIVSRGGIDANPKSLLQTTFDSSEPRLPVSNDHKRNFLDCVRDASADDLPHRPGRPLRHDLPPGRPRDPPGPQAPLGPEGRAVRQRRRSQPPAHAAPAQPLAIVTYEWHERKSEARNRETNSKHEIQMTETLSPIGGPVWDFEILVIRACFGFTIRSRISNFLLYLTPSSTFQVYSTLPLACPVSPNSV